MPTSIPRSELRVDVLAARARGESLRVIGRRLGLSKDTVQRIERDHGPALIRDLTGHLLTAEAQRRQGRSPGWPWITIPFQRLNDWQDALDMFSWACRELRKRGFDLEVVTRPTRTGLDLMLTITYTPGEGS